MPMGRPASRPRSSRPADRLLDGLGALSRRIGVHGDDGVDGAVGRLDAPQAALEQLDGRKLPEADQPPGLHSRKVAGVCHCCPRVRAVVSTADTRMLRKVKGGAKRPSPAVHVGGSPVYAGLQAEAEASGCRRRQRPRNRRHLDHHRHGPVRGACRVLAHGDERGAAPLRGRIPAQYLRLRAAGAAAGLSRPLAAALQQARSLRRARRHLALSMQAWFYAISLITIGEVTAISFLAPLFGTLGAIFLLGETVRCGAGRRWRRLPRRHGDICARRARRSARARCSQCCRPCSPA